MRDAFTGEAGLGGFVGVLIQGFRRAAFSNEAGCGSSPIVHSAARTEEPVREGFVALLEPFVDTVIVCTMTGIVVVVTGAYAEPDAGRGIAMTSWAFATVFPWFPIVLSLDRLPVRLQHDDLVELLRRAVLGASVRRALDPALQAAVPRLHLARRDLPGRTPCCDFGDLMILGMAFPNLIGVVLLSDVIRRELDRYWAKLQRRIRERRLDRSARRARRSRALLHLDLLHLA